MRITRVEAVPVALPLVEEFHWQGGAQVGANLVLFAVHTDDGVVGWGESVCEVPLATGTLVVCPPNERHWHGAARGHDTTLLTLTWGTTQWETTAPE